MRVKPVVLAVSILGAIPVTLLVEWVLGPVVAAFLGFNPFVYVTTFVFGICVAFAYTMIPLTEYEDRLPVIEEEPAWKRRG